MGPISVIIVSWNACRHLEACLISVLRTGGPSVREVIVVDNASVDGSPEMVAAQFPEVALIRSKINLGFARANNLGMRQATGSLFALVNSDVIVHPGCFQQLAAVVTEHHQVGLVGPKVFGGDGLLQLSCGRLPTLGNTACQFLALDRALPRCPALSGFQMLHSEHDRRKEVEVLSGCFWLARREAVDQVGGLDEQFFFYAEDIDWCRRFKNAGWKAMFVPEATATHHGGGSSANAPLRYTVVYLQSNLTYWKKHHGRTGWCAYWLLATIQHSLRLLWRILMRNARLTKQEQTAEKVREHLVCLRWLMTGKSDDTAKARQITAVLPPLPEIR